MNDVVNDKPKLLMLVGIPGSGKSTWAKKYIDRNKNYEVFSSDDLRLELFGDVNCQDRNHEVFEELHKRIIKRLSSGKNAIYDATNINSKRRKAFLDSISKIDCYKEAVVVAPPFEVCLRRNWMRERKVPYEVMERMYKGFQLPGMFEGWDKITPVIFPEYQVYSYDLFDYHQNNPWHKETLGIHMGNTFGYLKLKKSNNDAIDTKYIDEDLMVAGLFHDMGKPFCRVDDDNNISHYYSHENVGAYDAISLYQLPYNSALLINYHMLPMQWERTDYPDKTILMAKRKYGEDFVEKLLLLREADQASCVMEEKI